MRTFETPIYSELAFHYANKSTFFNIDKIIVPFPVQDYKGKYDVDGDLDWFRYYSGELSKEGYPMSVAQSSSQITWETNPCGLNYPLQIRDLKNFRNFSYTSEAQMEQRKWEFLSNLVKINREIKGVTFIEDDTNYDSGQVYTIGAGDLATSTVWSNQTTSNPVRDVNVVKRQNKWVTDMAFNYLTMCYLVEHPVLLDAATGDGPNPDAQSPIDTQLAWLSRVLGLRCSVFMSEAVTDSTGTIASQAKSDIWGTYVWFGRVDMESGPGNLQIPTWAHEYVFQPQGSGYEGFIANTTIDERAGLHGVMQLDLGYDNMNKVYAKSYGAKIKGVYA